MPFSAVCGHGPACMVDFGGESVLVDVKRCVQIGGRDIDDQERLRMKRAGVTVFPINAIDKDGMQNIIDRAIEIAGTDTAGIHLSFDIDSGDRYRRPQRPHRAGSIPGRGIPGRFGATALYGYGGGQPHPG